MKKLAFVLASLCMLAGCGKNESHWSHKNCVEEIAERLHLTDYVYSVKALDDGYKHGDDEVYCFDITVRANGMEWQYYCYAVIDDGEVMYVDCDYKG